MSHNLNIDAQEMAQRLQHPETLNLLDVREVMEYHTYNIGGLNIPLGKLPTVIEDLEWDKDEANSRQRTPA